MSESHCRTLNLSGSNASRFKGISGEVIPFGQKQSLSVVEAIPKNRDLNEGTRK